MKRYLMGLDAGTTSFKAALFDEEKNLAASVTTDYDLLTPGENIVEFPAEAYWKIFCDTAKRLLAKANIRGGQVEALALSSQGETLIALDAFGKPVGNAIVWLDNRAGREADELRERFGREEVYRVTGQADMLATWPAAKIRWLKKNRAEDYGRTAKFLLLEDYLVYRLTGRCVGELNLWASSAMLDIHMGEWWGEMLRELEISPDRLPELKDCGTRVGNVLPESAAECGLSPQTQVATGALDQTCNAIGCGLTLPGMICETTGSCLAVSAILDSFVPFDASMQMRRSGRGVRAHERRDGNGADGLRRRDDASAHHGRGQSRIRFQRARRFLRNYARRRPRTVWQGDFRGGGVHAAQQYRAAGAAGRAV